MSSGAGQVAQFLTDVCPSGIIFLPCEKGISHNSAEYALPDDLDHRFHEATPMLLF